MCCSAYQAVFEWAPEPTAEELDAPCVGVQPGAKGFACPASATATGTDSDSATTGAANAQKLAHLRLTMIPHKCLVELQRNQDRLGAAFDWQAVTRAVGGACP